MILLMFIIQINVDKRTAHTFNSGQAKLYDILLLHLHGGKDIFITVSGVRQQRLKAIY